MMKAEAVSVMGQLDMLSSEQKWAGVSTTASGGCSLLLQLLRHCCSYPMTFMQKHSKEQSSYLWTFRQTLTTHTERSDHHKLLVHDNQTADPEEYMLPAMMWLPMKKIDLKLSM